MKRVGAFIRELFHKSAFDLIEDEFIKLGREAILVKTYNRELLAKIINENTQEMMQMMVQIINASRR